MGRKWEGEELLKFYTFIVYNLGFIIERNQYYTEHPEQVTLHPEGAQPKKGQYSKSDKKSGKGSTKKNYRKRKALSNKFYRDMLAYITNTIGNPNQRKISHLRCKMSKFFLNKGNQDTKTINLRWRNGIINFEDLYTVYRTDPNLLLVSSSTDTPKTPHKKQEITIQDQLSKTFELELTVRERIPLDERLLNYIDWPSLMYILHIQLDSYLKVVEHQKEIFRRIDREMDEVDFMKAEKFIGEIQSKNRLIEKAIVFSNMHYSANGCKFDKIVKSITNSSSFNSNSVSNNDPREVTNVIQVDRVQKKAKVAQSAPHFMNAPILPIHNFSKKVIKVEGEPQSEMKIFQGQRMMQQIKQLLNRGIGLKNADQINYILPKKFPPQISQTKQIKTIDIEEIQDRIDSQFRSNKGQPSSTENFSLLGKRVNSLNPASIGSSFLNSHAKSKDASNFKVQPPPLNFGKSKAAMELSGKPRQFITPFSVEQDTPKTQTIHIPTVSEAIVKVLANSTQKIEVSPPQLRHASSWNQKQRKEISNFEHVPVTPAREPVPQIDEVRTSGVRYMKGLVGNFSNQTDLPNTLNISLDKTNQSIERQIFNPQLLTNFNFQGLNSGISNSMVKNNIGINSTLRNMPVSLIKQSNNGEATTSAEFERNQTKEQSSFNIEESSFSKRMNPPSGLKKRESKRISRFE